VISTRKAVKDEARDFVAVKALVVQAMVVQEKAAQGEDLECTEKGQVQTSTTTDMIQIVKCFSFF
jgi:hypothetical protein